MKHCPTCNAKYTDRYIFCREDGTALLADQAPAPDGAGIGNAIGVQEREAALESAVGQDIPAPPEILSSPVKYCPSCNSEYENRYRFCRLDGTALEEKPTPDVHKSLSSSEKPEGVKPDEAASPLDTQQVAEPLATSSAPLVEKAPPEASNGQQNDFRTTGKATEQPAGDASPNVESATATQSLRTKPSGSKQFELLVQEEIKKAFPGAFVRAGVQIRSFRRTAEADLFVLLPKGLFLIECKNYSGKISGSMNYDQDNGEFWTCETLSGESIQIKSSGKNPAEQALTRFWALHDMARDAWGEENRPYIFPVLLFLDTADLSGITGLTVYPERPSNRDRVVATTLSRLIPYLANAESKVERDGALKLMEFLGIPRSGLSGTWLVEQPAHVNKTTLGGNKQTDRQPSGKSYERPSEHSIRDAAHKGEIPKAERTDLKGSSPPGRHQDAIAGESVRNVRSKPGSRQARWPLVAFTVVVVALIGFMLVGQLTPKPSIEIASRNTPSPQPTSPLEPVVDPVSPVQAEVQSPPSTSGFVPGPSITRADKNITIEPQRPSRENKVQEARVRETPISRRPAEPGNYETIRITSVRREPNDRADVVDELRRGTKLNVTGSQGEWLVVKSRTRQMTVYVKRDDAMFVSVRSPGGESYQEAEVRWKKVEAEIDEALARRGVTGVIVSFVGDTAFLKGQVKTDRERFLAEMAAKSVPEVQHINNGIWVRP